MSLYNAVAGVDIFAPLCLRLLGLSASDVPRVRDAWFSSDGETITILTRTGGGNRPDYEAENEAMRNVDGFIKDFDDDFDQTFCRFTYETPERFQKDIRDITHLLNLIGRGPDTRGPRAAVERVNNTMKHTKTHNLTSESPEAVAALDALDRLMKCTDEIMAIGKRKH